MKQRQGILAVVAVGLISAVAWVWHESSQQQPEIAPGPAQVTALRDAFHQPTSAPAAASELAPAEASSSPQSVPAPVAAPEVQPPPVRPQAEPPQSVDTPEPAQRRFARGARSESEPTRPPSSEDSGSGGSEQN